MGAAARRHIRKSLRHERLQIREHEPMKGEF
jgi:hypothetical protein